jgi:hypothetical protein
MVLAKGFELIESSLGNAFASKIALKHGDLTGETFSTCVLRRGDSLRNDFDGVGEDRGVGAFGLEDYSVSEPVRRTCSP